MTRTRLIVAAVALGILGLSGCASAEEAPAPPPPASSPAPEPTPSVPTSEPEAEGTFITPAGLGSLRVGHPAAESDLVEYHPNFCIENMPPDSYEWDDPGRWVPTDGDLGFSLYVDEAGIVQVIDIRSPKYSTPEGIVIHEKNADEVRTAYPDRHHGVGGVGTTMEYVATPEGNLGFELGENPHEWNPEDADMIFNIQITAPGREPRGWAYSDALAGGCL
jgi:hypothetical protein